MPSLSLALVLLLFQANPADPVKCDLVIRGGTVFDGEGGNGVLADVAIRGEKIVAVGKFSVLGTPREFAARGLYVAPGFIDLHNHSDGPILDPKTRASANHLVQGVTTIVTGNCGFGPVNVAEYLAKIEAGGAGTNVIHLLPHGNLRQQAMGDANRPPTPAELAEMKRLAQQAMDDGAWGMSTGLIYTPGTFAQTAELIALAEVVGKNGGIYVSHIRDEGDGLLRSLDEILRIGREAKLPVHVSHFKVTGKANWGLAPDAIRKLQEARDAGERVTADQYPYTASSTSLSAMVIPEELRSWEKLKPALEDPELGPKTRARIEKSLATRDGGKSLVVANFAAERSWQGKSLADLAAGQQRSPLEVVLEIMRRGGAAMVSFGMSEDEVRLIMREKWVAAASDGSAQSLDSPSQPHPRSFGCFARRIGRYAIEMNILPVGQAIRSASGLPADILGLPERGYLRPGYVADLVVFDPKTYRDLATYDKPHQWAAGVRLTLVSGKIAVENEKPLPELFGKVLRHPKPAAPQTE